jgi:hypothetical protein
VAWRRLALRIVGLAARCSACARTRAGTEERYGRTSSGTRTTPAFGRPCLPYRDASLDSVPSGKSHTSLAGARKHVRLSRCRCCYQWHGGGCDYHRTLGSGKSWRSSNPRALRQYACRTQ